MTEPPDERNSWPLMPEPSPLPLTVRKEEPQRTESERIELGEQANNILASLAYTEAYQMMLDINFEKWANSAPKDVELREKIYHRVAVMQEITEQLGELVNVARGVYAEQAREEGEYNGRS